MEKMHDAQIEDQRAQASARARAAAIIVRWLETGDFPNLLLENARADRAFLVELVYGIVRWKRLLDWVVARYVRRSPVPSQQAFLLVGLYQLLKMTEVVAYAAVHETVEAAKAALGGRQADFVNAILRRTLREKDALLAELERQPIGIRQSHPDELLARWLRHFGNGPTEALCAWNNRRADVIIRVNQLKITPEAYIKTLATLGVGDQVSPFNVGKAATEANIEHRTPNTEHRTKDFLYACFTLAHGVRVADLPGYAEGHFMVIDPAAIRAVELLDPQPGERVLDACAAPGGKTALIAERMRLAGTLVAMDLGADRQRRLHANLERMRCAAFVKVVQGDARRLRPESFGRFDRVLLDVPCSNTGVIRRKPDVRWRFSKTAMARLVAAQRALLENAAGLVQRGGRLVYSTCSLEPEENEQLVSAWLQSHPAWTLARTHHSFPPHSATDGAYAVALVAR